MCIIAGIDNGIDSCGTICVVSCILLPTINDTW